MFERVPGCPCPCPADPTTSLPPHTSSTRDLRAMPPSRSAISRLLSRSSRKRSTWTRRTTCCTCHVNRVTRSLVISCLPHVASLSHVHVYVHVCVDAPVTRTRPRRCCLWETTLGRSSMPPSVSRRARRSSRDIRVRARRCWALGDSTRPRQRTTRRSSLTRAACLRGRALRW